MKAVDPGHRYLLLTLDGDHAQILQFVKREGVKFPGNVGTYPGTTLQSVIRALLERMRYLQRQAWSLENAAIIGALRASIWLLEFRAARRHGRTFFHGLRFSEEAPMCGRCGHTLCDHEKE